MPLAVEKIDISKFVGKVILMRQTLKSKYKKSLESEFITTTNNGHNLLNEAESEIKRWGD